MFLGVPSHPYTLGTAQPGRPPHLHTLLLGSRESWTHTQPGRPPHLHTLLLGSGSPRFEFFGHLPHPGPPGPSPPLGSTVLLMWLLVRPQEKAALLSSCEGPSMTALLTPRRDTPGPSRGPCPKFMGKLLQGPLRLEPAELGDVPSPSTGERSWLRSISLAVWGPGWWVEWGVLPPPPHGPPQPGSGVCQGPRP